MQSRTSSNIVASQACTNGTLAQSLTCDCWRGVQHPELLEHLKTIQDQAEGCMCITAGAAYIGMLSCLSTLRYSILAYDEILVQVRLVSPAGVCISFHVHSPSASPAMLDNWRRTWSPTRTHAYTKCNQRQEVPAELHGMATSTKRKDGHRRPRTLKHAIAAHTRACWLMCCELRRPFELDLPASQSLTQRLACMQWKQTQTPTDAELCGVLARAMAPLLHTTELITTTCNLHAPEWSPRQRHFLATFLTAAVAAIVTRHYTSPCTRDLLLRILDEQAVWQSHQLSAEGLDAAERDGGADELLQRVRAELAGPLPRPGTEAQWVAALAWTLYLDLCNQAAADDRLKYLQAALRSTGANPRTPMVHSHHPPCSRSWLPCTSHSDNTHAPLDHFVVYMQACPPRPLTATSGPSRIRPWWPRTTQRPRRPCLSRMQLLPCQLQH